MRLLLLILVLAAQSPLTRSVEIWSTDPIAVDIEWITIDAGGKQVVTARKQTAAGPPAALDFAHGPDRFVRFSYQGASPRTYSTSELLAAKKMHVPDVLPGGELLIVSHQMPVRAARVDVTGPRVRTFDMKAPHVSFAGIPAGTYTITPIYEGGIKAVAVTARIEPAKTALVFLPPDDLGAVRITAVDDVCRGASEVGINAIVTPSVGPQLQRTVNRSRVFISDKPACDMTIGGLKPGRHEAYFRRQQSRLGSREFSAAAQQIAHVDLTGLPIVVQGRVTLNGRPITDATVTFHWRGDRDDLVPEDSGAKVDAGGYYSVALERPGKYMVMSRPMDSKNPMREAEFAEGRHVYDLAMTGGRIVIKLLNHEKSAGISVQLFAPDGSARAMSFSGRPGAEMVMQPLAWGEYRVSIRSGPPNLRTAPPDTIRVSLSEGNPEVTLTHDAAKR